METAYHQLAALELFLLSIDDPDDPEVQQADRIAKEVLEVILARNDKLGLLVSALLLLHFLNHTTLVSEVHRACDALGILVNSNFVFPPNVTYVTLINKLIENTSTQEGLQRHP
jgi:hypothetical protein